MYRVIVVVVGGTRSRGMFFQFAMAQSRCIEAGADRGNRAVRIHAAWRRTSRSRTDRPAARPAPWRSREPKSGGYTAVFTLNGYLPDTGAGNSTGVGWATTPRSLRPNPVVVQLTPAPPPPKPKKKRVRHRRHVRPKPAVKKPAAKRAGEAEAGRRQAGTGPDEPAGAAAGALPLAAGAAAAALIRHT